MTVTESVDYQRIQVQNAAEAAKRGFVKDYPTLCPICGCRFLVYRKADRPGEEFVQRNLAGFRTTCGAMTCQDAEAGRLLARSMNEALDRMEAERSAQRQAESEKMQRAQANKLHRLGKGV